VYFCISFNAKCLLLMPPLLDTKLAMHSHLRKAVLLLPCFVGLSLIET
jgi:hypothetical protein